MNASQRHGLVVGAIASSSLLLEKSASATPDSDIISPLLETYDGMTKSAELAQLLAAGTLSEQLSED